MVQPSVSLTSFLHFDVLLYETYDKKESIFYVIKRQNVVNGNIINVSVLQSIIRINLNLPVDECKIQLAI